MISFSLLSFRPFSGSGLIEIPAVPGGPGILINPSGSWTSSRPPTRTSSAARPSRPLRSRAFSGCFGVFSGLFLWAFSRLVVSRKSGCVRSVWFLGLVAVSLFGVRAVCSWVFCRIFGGVFLACCVVLRSCIFSLGKEHPPASRPQWRLTPHPL